MDSIPTIIPILAVTTGAEGAGEWGALIFYVVIALGVSFLCSVWEAAMLSTPVSHIELLVQQGSKAGVIMQGLRQNVEHPISAILTLNTIAHTVGAAGAGAEATAIFGSEFFGIISAALDADDSGILRDHSQDAWRGLRQSVDALHRLFPACVAGGAEAGCISLRVRDALDAAQRRNARP